MISVWLRSSAVGVQPFMPAEPEHGVILSGQGRSKAVFETAADYRCLWKPTGEQMLTDVITALRRGIPAKLTELKKLGRTLNRRATDVLACFDQPGTPNGPTEAICAEGG